MGRSEHSGGSGAREAKASAWRRRMSQWERSGLSQWAYCRRRELALSTFVYWRKKLRYGASPAEKRHPPPCTGFIPVHVKEDDAAGLERSGGWACEVAGAQGVKVRFSSRPSLARLGKLVALLAGVAR